MALVAYDYSSESESEETNTLDSGTEDSFKVTSNNLLSESVTSQNIVSTEINDNSINEKHIDSEISEKIAHLPESRSVSQSNHFKENDKLEDFIPTVKSMKEKKVKIMIPSLSEFDDIVEDEPLRKRAKASERGSGLLRMLPPIKTAPMTSTSFIPNSVNKKINSQKASTCLIPQSIKKNMKVNKQPKEVAKSDSDSDSELTGENDNTEMWERICGRPSPKPSIPESQGTDPQPFVNIVPEPEKPLNRLDNNAFKELVGKNKRPMGNIELIDINEDQILPDKELWMTKSLTDPEMAPRAQIGDQVDPTIRRKHHITYLAQQAKANEQELKSAWAAGKNNRIMSRAKYGF